MPSNITVVSVCIACLFMGIKYFIEKLQWYHRNKVLKSFGHAVLCTDFSLSKEL